MAHTDYRNEHLITNTVILDFSHQILSVSYT